MHADLIIQNGRIRTLDPTGTIAQSVAVLNGWIIGIGSNQDLRHLIGQETESIDLGGKTALPGFIDAHEHLSLFAEIPLQLDLSTGQVSSLSELLAKISEAAKGLKPGEWIRGMLYDDTKMAEKRILNRYDLDKAAPNNPVFVLHVSAHWSIVNSQALQMGGLNENSLDPKGGVLGRDSDTGRLTGQLIENAMFNFAFPSLSETGTVVPPYPRDVRKKALLKAVEVLNAAGVTGVGDALVSPGYVISYHDLAADSSLLTRVNMLIPYIFLPQIEKLGLPGKWGNEWVRCTGIKIILDGAIAGRTAALRGGYAHDPDDHGVLLIEDQSELNELVKRIHNMGYQACIHANGDLAIEMALNAIESAQAGNPRHDPRHRLEHCTMIDDTTLSRMRALGVIALPFGSYVWQHGEKLVRYYGEERAQTMFAHKSFLDAGVRVAGSSDHPAGLHPPLLGVQCMVTRKTSSGEVIGRNQRISLEEAFKMYAIYAAYASFEEGIKGSLIPGRLADIVILAEDPWSIDPDGISQIEIDMTIVGGKIAYSRT
ncbi:MAG: amidohydrolase [Desulfobacterales bacterium]|nr:amidohydrolase [Desulfobacterales bacterium]MBL7172104.1 amidohydrolase [Desulfobacteraceae bacterium]